MGVDPFMRCYSRFLVTLSLVVFAVVSCARINWGQSGNSRSGGRNPSASIPEKIPSRLLPTLAVGVEFCYVFLQPDGDAPFFGPLRKGELLKRIDTEGYWILVWIPRLRISGWVRKTQLYIVYPKTIAEETVPTKYLTLINILKRRVNIRKSPSTRSTVIFKARQRQEFVMLNEKTGWYQIWIPRLKRKGWVAESIVVKQRRR
jgi:hypothetical protein